MSGEPPMVDEQEPPANAPEVVQVDSPAGCRKNDEGPAAGGELVEYDSHQPLGEQHHRCPRRGGLGEF